MNTSALRRPKSAFGAAALLLLGPASVLTLPSAHAATTHKLTSTGANNWSTATWDTGAPTAASAGDTAQYTVNTAASTTTLNVSGVTIGFLTQTGSGPWTINSPTNALTLDTGTSAAAAITNAFTAGNITNFTVDVNLSLNSSLSLVSGANISHASTLTLGSSVGGHAITGGKNITLTSGNASVTINDNISTSGSITDTFNNTVTNTIAGVIGSSVTGVTLNSVSGHSLLLSGLNTYTSATTISLGTLTAGVGQSGTAGAFGNNSAVSLANAAGATLNLANFNESIGSLTGGGANGGNVTLGSGALTVGGDNTSPAYAGVISGAGGQLTKVGTGTQTLTNANIYTGSTTISSGELRLDNTAGSATGTGAVNETGGLLSGVGTSTGPLTVTGSAVIAPGDNPAGTHGKAGTLSVGTTGGATLSSAELDFDLSANGTATAVPGSNDQIVTGGAPSLGTLAFKFYETGGLDTTNPYTIISSAGTPTLQNGATLAGYAAAATISGPGAYKPTFGLTSSGLTVKFTAAPEPGQTATLSLIGVGLLGLFLRARPRRMAAKNAPK